MHDDDVFAEIAERLRADGVGSAYGRRYRAGRPMTLDEQQRRTGRIGMLAFCALVAGFIVGGWFAVAGLLAVALCCVWALTIKATPTTRIHVTQIVGDDRI